MTERTRNRLADLKARQDVGVHMPCPRCGMDTMKTPVCTNALSRVADIYVCDSCGTAEALLGFMNQTLPLHQWCAFEPNKAQADYIMRPTSEVLALVIQKHIDELTHIFKLCIAEPENAMEYRNEAFESCAGLTELWVEPFQAKFAARDGAVLIRFLCTDDGVVQMSAGMVDK